MFDVWWKMEIVERMVDGEEEGWVVNEIFGW